MIVNQISVFVENRPGRLAEITGILAAGGVDIRALSIADTSDFGILRLIVNDPERTDKLLREAGVTSGKTAVIAVKLADEPGSLHKILTILSNHDVVVEYAYAFITRKDSDAYVILKVANNDEAIAMLTAEGQQMLTPEEFYAL
ncbi:MAG: ACT domain-containing protein [Oscillospiraceae bacterium]|jgi:hypothetical protein|nr:ACT domain-containing protein [Oscillospiraceae bacterium]